MTLDTAPPRDPASKSRLRLWLRLLKASRRVEEDLRRRFRDDFATTLPRFDVLSALARAPEGLRMSDISDRLRVSNGNVTGIVDRLVAEGLADREAVPGDRRALRIRLTEAGRAAFAAQAAAHEGWIDDLLGAVPRAEADRLGERLSALARSLEERRP